MGMTTSAEELHGGKLNLEPSQNGGEKLFIDLDLCATGQCKTCEIQCSYFYHAAANNGIASVAELATYALVCRRCEEPHCVNACPEEALEQQSEKEKLLIRHNMRCVSCKSCSTPARMARFIRKLSRTSSMPAITALIGEIRKTNRCVSPPVRTMP
jgi:Fe-S-cluster-containing hydrogenase component 2